jgi:ATP-dependent Clp protease adaptor protein ClpS
MADENSTFDAATPADGDGDAGGGAATLAPVRETETATREQNDTPWLWHVVLYDSDDHTYEYVIMMLTTLFPHSAERAYQLAKRIDEDGRGVVYTTHRELAELKAEQVRGFGPDPLIASCATSLSVTLEPACYSGDERG